MNTKDNYVHQVFSQELAKYPTSVQTNIAVPNYGTFQLEFVPPQYDPENVYNDSPDLYHRMHGHIIDSHLSQYEGRKNRRIIEMNLYSVLSSLEREQLKYVIGKYLELSGRSHTLYTKWSFLDHPRFRIMLKSRISLIREDLVNVVRKSLNDLAYNDSKISKDVCIFIKMMLNID